MFLGIAGLVAIIIGLLYLVADGELPHCASGHHDHGPRPEAAVACLGGGAICAGRRLADPGAPPRCDRLGLGSPHVLY